MAKFIEVLVDGLTVERKVQLAGARVQVSEDFSSMTKKQQSKRWGKPRYKEISKADFEGSGGQVEDDEAAGADGDAEQAEASPFDVLEGLNVEETLQAVADFGDEQMSLFVAYEKENANRKGVLEALGFEE